jgi:diaminopimelate epimerase
MLRLQIQPDGRVAVDMGQPKLEPSEIPFFATERAKRYAIAADGMDMEIGVVSMGNPHAVLVVDNVDQAPVAHLGPLLERHGRFPNAPTSVSCRSWPRIISGFGFRTGCRRDPGLRQRRLRGGGDRSAVGSAMAECPGGIAGRRIDDPLGRRGRAGHMTGPAETVFEGRIEW